MGVAADMLIVLPLALLSGLHAAPVEKALKKGGVQAIASCKDCGPTADGLNAVDGGGDQPIAERVMGGEEAEDPAAAEAGADIDLLEDEDEAIGDRIKDKFDTALKRIGDEIDKDQAEQNEKNAGQ